jgi:hypothetical protein
MPVEIVTDASEQEAKKQEDEAAKISDSAIVARYKIEIIFNKDRSMSSLKPSVGMMLAWESGKHYHGGGDDQMYWCGYDDCNKLMSTDNFAMFSAVCPHCRRESFLDPDSKTFHVREVRKRGDNPAELAKMPIIVGQKVFKMTPPKLAELIYKVWMELGSNADIYLKYHPSDIRYSVADDKGAKISDRLTQGRATRGKLIYPLKNILKDTAAGADVQKRFLAMITA